MKEKRGQFMLWGEDGLERVFVGLEFFRDEDLKYVRKNSIASDKEAAVRILHGLNIDVYASFIIRPEFKEADFTALRQYCQRLELNFASFAMLTPLPNTDLYEEVKDKLITCNYDYFDFIHTQHTTVLPLKEFYAEYQHLYTN
jgi:methyltransferase